MFGAPALGTYCQSGGAGTGLLLMIAHAGLWLGEFGVHSAALTVRVCTRAPFCHSKTMMLPMAPPCVNAETTRMSPLRCSSPGRQFDDPDGQGTPVKGVALVAFAGPPRLIAFWKNQNPMFESPLSASRSAPKKIQVCGVPPPSPPPTFTE